MNSFIILLVIFLFILVILLSLFIPIFFYFWPLWLILIVYSIVKKRVHKDKENYSETYTHYDNTQYQDPNVIDVDYTIKEEKEENE